MSRGRARTYEDYETLGRILEDLGNAIAGLHQQLWHMFPVEDEQGRPMVSRYDQSVLAMSRALLQLQSELATEFHVEMGEAEAPSGIPRTPPYRGEGGA